MPSPDASQFPAALDTVASLMQVINNYATTLPNAINSSQTSIQVTSAVGLNAPGTVAIGTEVIYYAGITISGPTHTLTGCIRGFDSTTAAAAAAQSKVEQRWVAVHHNLLASAISAIETVLGVNPQGAEATLATLLARNLPAVVPFSSPTSNWSLTHDRRRLVVVQLWRLVTGNTYEMFEADIEQIVDTGGPSQVNITLTANEAGYAVIV